MSGPDVNLILRSTRVVTPEGTRPAAVAVAGGTIDAVLPYDTGAPAGARLEDFGDDVLLPGLVDTHVHVNDPGRTAWEGFYTATRAAAAGGITTLLDMPLNSLPPTTTVENLRIKQQVAAPKAHVDTGFWGGAIPSNVKDLRPLYEAGVFGFKCFLSPSGVEEFPELDQEQLARSMAEITGFGGLLIVHAEDPHHLAEAPQRSGPAYADFLASRPRDAENTAIEGLIAHAKRLNARVHVLHLSSSDALPLIAAAKREGVRVTVESCPHFLTLTAEEVPDGATEFKCCPPIREAANQDALWAGLADGTIDCIVSDHSPHHRPEDPGLRLRLGRHLLPPARPPRHLDRGPQARPLPRRRRPLDVRGPRRAGRADPQGRHRGRARRRLRGPRPRRDLHRRPRRALPPQPGHRLRREDPARCRPLQLAARCPHRLRRRTRRARRPPPRTRPLTELTGPLRERDP